MVIGALANAAADDMTTHPTAPNRPQYFNLQVLNNGVYAKVSEPLLQDPANLPARCNLFAISNVFGWAVAATPDGACWRGVVWFASPTPHRPHLGCS